MKLELETRSEFDQYSGESAWLKSHITLIRGYPTFADRYAGVVPTIAYHDYYTEYTQAGKPLCTKANRDPFVAIGTRDVRQDTWGRS